MFVEPTGSGPATVPRPQHQPSGAPTQSAPDTSPAKAWSDAVAQATTNSPQQHVTVKPGDTLTGIATSHNDTLPSVEETNPQVSDPNLIYPRETVYLPKTTPAEVVTGVHNSQIKQIITAMANANLADRNLQETPQIVAKLHLRDPSLINDAQTQSTNSWNTVTQTTYKMLTNNNYNPHPDQSARAQVQQLNALEPGNAKFAAANNAALAEATQHWKQMGVIGSRWDSVIGAYNDAKRTSDSVSQYLQNSKLPHNPAIVGDLNASERQTNAQLQGEIESWLTKYAGGNPTAAAIADHAGTLAKFGPPDHAFQAAVQNATYDLQVVKPAQQVANAYATGMAHGGASVAAQTAAQKLREVTHNAGDSRFALSIIQNSQGTIDQITREMGSLAAGSMSPINPSSSSAQSQFNQIYADLSRSVNAATTVHWSVGAGGKVSLSLGADQTAAPDPAGNSSAENVAARDLVGNSIAKNVPKNLTPYQAGFYEAAAANAIANRDGAALTLATAPALKKYGDPRVASVSYGLSSNTNPTDMASYLLEGAAQGFQGLKSKADSDVGSFSANTASLYQLQTTWTPFMTNSQLARATNGYIADHPDVAQKAKSELETIRQDGNAIVEAESAWNTYRAHLGGLKATKDLADAAASLTGHDNAAALAVSQSTTLNTAIANTLVPLMAQLGGRESGWQSWPGWNSIGSGRSALSSGSKAASKSGGLLFPKGNLREELANRLSLPLSVIGLGLTIQRGVADGVPFNSSFSQDASSTYTALGFVKYVGETYSGVAKLNGLPDKLNYGNAGGARGFFFGKDAADLTKSPAFQALGFFYYGAGAFTAGAAAADASNNSNVETTLDAAEALGNAGNAAKSLVGALKGMGVNVLEDGALEEIGFAFSVVGLAATLASLGWQIANAASRQAANVADNAKFLEQGLGLNPRLAQSLAAPVASSLSLSPALQQYAKANGMTPGQLLLKLNDVHTARGYPLANVEQFIYQASRMPMQSNGKYASSVPGDNGNGISKIEIFGPNGEAKVVPEPLPANSLNQLKYWAQVLFGNQLG